MKKYIGLMLLPILAFSGVSCDESSFLEEKPRAELYPENLLQNYDGFKSMNISLYGMARAEYRRADALGGSIPQVLHSAWDGGTDVAWANNSSSAVQFMYNPKLIDRTDLELFSNIFQWCYRIINTANMVITRAENGSIDWKGSTPAASEANKNEVLAEARFFRAWSYRHLTLTFGAVPLSTEEITGLNYRNDWERNSVEEIRKVMEEDFEICRRESPYASSQQQQGFPGFSSSLLG